MSTVARPIVLALGLGVTGWLVFLLVAATMARGGAADPSQLYPAEWSFAAGVLARNLALCATLWLVARLLTRRGEALGRMLCSGAAILLVGVWATRAGLSVGDLGLAVEGSALLRATAPHTGAELGLIVLPLVAAATARRPGMGWLAGAGAGLAVCAVAEAFL
jgi:hypothetical protein